MNTTPTEKWLEDLTLELRLRDVSGVGVGDTLATVKEHLADSGDDPAVAFGSPRAYAESLDLSGYIGPVSLTGTIIRSGIGLIAMLVFTQAVWPWAAGEAFDIGLAQMVWMLVPLFAVVTLPLTLNTLIRRTWLLILVIVVCTASGFVSVLTAPRSPDEAWLSIDPVLVLVPAAAVMLAASILSTRAIRVDVDDSIREPLADPAVAAKVQATSRTSALVAAWLFPAFAAVSFAVAFLFRD